MLDVAERLMQAAGADLGMVTTVVWEVDFLPGLKAFWYPDRLWRVEVPGCFDRVRMPDLVGHTEQDEWDLRDRTDRRRLYENLLVEGDQHMIMRWVDGALLVDVWTELVLPDEDPGGLGARSRGGIDRPEPWRVRRLRTRGPRSGPNGPGPGERPRSARHNLRWVRQYRSVATGTRSWAAAFSMPALSSLPWFRSWLLSSSCGAVLMCFSLLVVGEPSSAAAVPNGQRLLFS